MADSVLKAFIKSNPKAALELNTLVNANKRQSLDSQTVKRALYYWSKCRIAGTVTGGVLTIPIQTAKLFSYKLGGDMASAGIPGVVATESETNIEKESSTNGAENVRVMGIAVQLSPDTDTEFAKRVFLNSAVRIVGAGGTPTRLGPLSMLPGAGGIFGGGATALVEAPLAQSLRDASAPANGYPSGLNYRPLPEPLLWSATGPDATLNVEVSVTRPIVVTLPAGRAATAGVAAYIQPTTGTYGTYMDLLAILMTQSQAGRSNNA